MERPREVESWGPVDQFLAQTLVVQGVLVWEALPTLHERARREGWSRKGSLLAEAVVREGIVTAATVDVILQGFTGAEVRPAETIGTRTANFFIAQVLAAEEGTAPESSASAPSSQDDDPDMISTRPMPAVDPVTHTPVAPVPFNPQGETLAGDQPLPIPFDPKGETTDQMLVPANETFRDRRILPLPQPTTVEAESAPRPGDVVDATFTGDRYVVLDPNPSGDEHLVLDRRTRRRLVMRWGRPEPVTHPSFYREPRILAQLDHPVIRRVHELGLRDGRPFYTADELEGRTLADSGDDDLADRIRNLLGIAAALEHAHGVGLVHGGLDPECVVLGDFGQVSLTGWGLAGTTPQATEAVRRAAEAPPPPSTVRCPAPELSAGQRPQDPGSDVWGLGVLLHVVLFGELPDPDLRDAVLDARGKPRELLAVAHQALDPDPNARYRSAAAFREDLRRYLDGRAVSASAEGGLQTLRRLARHNPVPAGVLGLAALGILGLGIGATLAGHARWSAAEASRVDAEQRRVEAREATERAHTDLEDLRGSVATAIAEQEFESVLSESVGSSDPEAAFARAEELTVPDRDQRMARLRRIRAQWRLREGLPAPALVDFRALVANDPRDAHALFGVLRAARRIPGPEARIAERLAHEALQKVEGPYAQLTRAELLVQQAEEQAYRGDETLQRQYARQARDLLERVPKDAVRSSGELAWRHELLGRSQIAMSGLLRTQKEAWHQGLFHQGLDHLMRAAALDPAALEPRLRLVHQWRIKFGRHAMWRWVTSWQWGEVLRVGRTVRRTAPLVALAEQLQLERNPVASLPWAQRAIQLAKQERITDLTHARIVLARARLHAGEQVPPRDLDPSGTPPELEPQLLTLRGWALLIDGRSKEGLAALSRAGKAPRLNRDVTTLMKIDTFAALTDPRADGRAVLRSLRRLERVPNPPLLAQVSAGLVRDRLGLPFRLTGIKNANPAQTEGGLLLVLADRAELRRDPDAPILHARALQLWAHLNMQVDRNELVARAARALILERLQLLNRKEHAARFEVLQPGKELWVPRAWQTVRGPR